MLSSSHSQGRVNSQLQLSSCTANSAGERGVGESIACCRPEEASCGPNAERTSHLQSQCDDEYCTGTKLIRIWEKEACVGFELTHELTKAGLAPYCLQSFFDGSGNGKRTSE